jgi:hypothetical protein
MKRLERIESANIVYWVVDRICRRQQKLKKTTEASKTTMIHE